MILALGLLACGWVASCTGVALWAVSACLAMFPLHDQRASQATIAPEPHPAAWQSREATPQDSIRIRYSSSIYSDPEGGPLLHSKGLTVTPGPLVTYAQRSQMKKSEQNAEKSMRSVQESNFIRSK